MELIYKIRNCRSMDELDQLRIEIDIAGRDGEIADFALLKTVFLARKMKFEANRLIREKHLRVGTH